MKGILIRIATKDGTLQAAHKAVLGASFDLSHSVFEVGKRGSFVLMGNGACLSTSEIQDVAPSKTDGFLDIKTAHSTYRFQVDPDVMEMVYRKAWRNWLRAILNNEGFFNEGFFNEGYLKTTDARRKGV